MAATRAVRAVGFDFDHTLGIDNKLERVAFLHLLHAACENGGHAIGELAEETARIDQLLEEQRSGAFSIEEAVERFMREHGAGDPGAFADRYKQLALENARAFIIAQPGAPALLDELRRRGVPAAILTNGWSPLQQRKAECIGFSGPVVVSSELGVQKPEKAAFAALARALGAPPGDIAYVGDSPAADVAGALEAGMLGVWFDAEGAHYPADLPKPAAVIHSLAELPGIL